MFKILFLALIVIALGAEIPNTDLREKNEIFHDKKFEEVAKVHLQNDDEFKAAIKYLQSKEWMDILMPVVKRPEWKTFQKMLDPLKINISSAVTCFTNNIQKLKVEGEIPKGTKMSLHKYLVDIGWDNLTLALLKNMNIFSNLTDFQSVYNQMATPETLKMVDDFRSLPEVKKLLSVFKELGINMDELFSTLYMFFGWQKVTTKPKL